MAKVKVATIWLEGCAGCHMSFLDIDEAIIDVSKLVEFTRSPITDIKKFSPVDVGIVEGSVGNTEEEETLEELRANCKILMALQVGDYLITRIQYSDCTTFEGQKILVYKTTETELAKQMETVGLDPHFSKNKKYHSPIARFIPNLDGWRIAVKLTQMLS